MAGRVVQIKLEVDWARTGVFTDETAYFLNAQGRMSWSPPGESLSGGQGIVDDAQVTVVNPGRRFSAEHDGGALYANLQNGGVYGAVVKLSVNINAGGWQVIFTGKAKSYRENRGTADEAGEVTLDCRTYDDDALQFKESTTQAYFRANVLTPKTEADIIEDWLTLAGLTAGQMDLDPGLWPITYAWLDEESVLEDAWQLAAAAGGVLYASRDGKVVYRNANYLIDLLTASPTAFTKDDYQGLEIRYNDDDLYSDLVAEIESRSVGPADVVWEHEDPYFSVPPGQTKSVVARLNAPLFDIIAFDYDAAGPSGYTLGAYASVTITEANAQRVTFSVQNTHPYLTLHLRKLSLVGRPVVGSQSKEIKVSSSHSFWTNRKRRTRDIKLNAYVQSEDQARYIAQHALWFSDHPRVIASVQGLTGTPAVVPGSKIRVTDDKVFSKASVTYRDLLVTDVQWQLSIAGYTMAVEATELAHSIPCTAFLILNDAALGKLNDGRVTYV